MSKEGEVGPVPDLWLRRRELRERREAGDRSQLTRRAESLDEALVELGVGPLGLLPPALLASISERLSMELALHAKKRELLALRSEANAEDTSRVAQIRTAIDRLGALWAVVE